MKTKQLKMRKGCKAIILSVDKDWEYPENIECPICKDAFLKKKKYYCKKCNIRIVPVVNFNP